MELSVRLGLFFVALKIQEISGSEGSVCPCVRPSECSTLPAYGVNVLDIQQFGVLAPCVAWGHIRCCPRIKEDTPDRTELDNQTYPLATSNLACGCVPKGLCTLKKRATSAQCYGYFELCCPETSAPDLSERRPAPVFAPQNLVCVDKSRCQDAYGDSYLDVANYGTLAPCAQFGHVRCITLRSKGAETPVTLDNTLSVTKGELEGTLPRIYVEKNGTLVISGGSPVIYAPGLPPPQPQNPPEVPGIVQSFEPGDKTDVIKTSEMETFMRNLVSLVQYLMKKKETKVTLDNGERKIQFEVSKSRIVSALRWIDTWKVV